MAGGFILLVRTIVDTHPKWNTLWKEPGCGEQDREHEAFACIRDGLRLPSTFSKEIGGVLGVGPFFQQTGEIG